VSGVAGTITTLGRRAATKGLRLGQIVRAYANWPEVLRETLPGGPDGQLMVRCRSGLRMMVRRGTSDMYIVSEGMAYGAYRSVNPILASGRGPRTVVDLGGHIGVFSLLCAQADPDVRVVVFEPGPDNIAMLRRNAELNPGVGSRIEAHEAAVGAGPGHAYWELDARDPSGSHIVEGGRGQRVELVGMKQIIAACPHPIACMKIDVEGGEYALLDGSDPEDWAGVPAVLVELHPDPAGVSSPERWLERMRELGFVERERHLETVVLTRA